MPSCRSVKSVADTMAPMPMNQTSDCKSAFPCLPKPPVGKGLSNSNQKVRLRDGDSEAVVAAQSVMQGMGLSTLSILGAYIGGCRNLEVDLAARALGLGLILSPGWLFLLHPVREPLGSGW